MSARFTGILISVLVGVAGAGGYWLGRTGAGAAAAIDKTPAGEPEPVAVPVETTPIVEATLAETETAYGVVQPRPTASRTVTVPFEATVVRVLVSPGQRVQAGAELMEVGASAETRLLHQQAQDAVAAAEENLKQVQRRVEDRLATNTELAAARQADRAARTQLQSFTQRGVGEPHLLKAEVDGVVESVAVQQGQVAPIGTPLLLTRAENDIEVRLGVEPALIASIKPNQSFTIHPVSRPKSGQDSAAEPAAITGTVRFISTQLNPQTRLIDVYVVLTPESRLMAGAFVSGEWAIGESTGLVVPRTAVHEEAGKWILFSASGGKAHEHEVTLGAQESDRVVVIGEELHAGDRVITATNGELEDGTAIEPDSATSQPATSTSTTKDSE